MKLSRLFKRLGIIFSWIVLIFTALYFPSWSILPSEEKSINIFAWGDLLDPKILADFEKETGIKVYLSYYATNEELLVKMKATGGEGYDLIIPSSYTVALLIKDQLLKPLDHSQFKHWNDLYSALLNHPFDPENQYSIPFEWEIYGFGVDRRFFKEKPFLASWKSVFDPAIIDYKIALNNDPMEAVLFASLYLYGTTDTLTEQQFQEIRALLLEQRKWVEAYSDFRADYFIATGNCPVALSTIAYIKRIRNFFPNIEFVIPKEGTFVSIENFCIPKASEKEKYIYQLLNYLYKKESLIAHYKNFWYYPASLSILDDINLSAEEQRLYHYSREEFSKFHFFKNVVPQKKVRDLWVEVKSF